MKFNAKNVQISTFVRGGAVVSFDCSEYTKAQLQNLKLDNYTIAIEKINKKRSLNQNALLWELIGQICEKENGNKVETEDIYLQLLESAGASVDFLLGIPESEETLKKIFRIVKVVDERIMNNRQMFVYKCYMGSSTFDTKQMTMLIEKTLERAENDGIDTEYWKEELYNEREKEK